jgi:hydrophobic/amphiphilic exporter-1 (mainly G- bacteria), HAE1 family
VLASDTTKSPQELTTWASQVLQKRLENVRGVGAVTVVGGVQRQINLYVKPAQLEAFGIGVDQVVAAVRSENQELPMGAIRSLEQEQVVQINARLKRPEDFREIVVARRNGLPVKLWQLADVTGARCCCRCRSRRARTRSQWSTACTRRSRNRRRWCPRA